MPQYQAGYYSDGLKKIVNKSENQHINNLLNYLSYFELDFNKLPENPQNDTTIAIAGNLISRGLPTINPLYVEQYLAENLSLTIEKKQNNIHFELLNTQNETFDYIFKSLHIIDPRIKKDNFETLIKNNPAFSISSYQYDFLYSILPTYLGEQFLQLVEYKRSLDSLQYSTRYHLKTIKPFVVNDLLQNENIDFSFECPYTDNDKFAYSVFIDDLETKTISEQQILKEKIKVIEKAHWHQPLVIEKDDRHTLTKKIEPLRQFARNSYFETIYENYTNPIFHSDEGLDYLQLCLSPFAVARFQKTIIEAIQKNMLSLTATKWEIGVIERDVPCAFLALEDLKQLLKMLFLLEGEKRNIPEIKLTVYNTQEFEHAKLNKNFTGKIKNINEFDTQKQFDLLIDVSVLQRKIYNDINIDNNACYTALVRSVLSISSQRTFSLSENYHYKPLYKYQTSETNKEIREDIKTAYEYFAKLLLRNNNASKVGQHLTDRMLHGYATFGQINSSKTKIEAILMASILQPGQTLMVLPSHLHTLNLEEHLKNLGIDALCSYNSLNTEEEVKILTQKIKNAETLITLTTACRWYAKISRNQCFELLQKNTLHHVIIDEAHNCSEWAHESLIEYFSIIELIKEINKEQHPKRQSITAFSAYTSYNVLEKIRKQLQVKDKDILNDKAEFQDNTKFKVTEISSNELKKDIRITQAQTLINRKKQVKVSHLLKEILENTEKNNQGKFQKILCICSQQYGLDGILDDNYDGLEYKLQMNFPNIEIDHITGINNHILYPVSKAESKVINQKFIEFKNNKFQLLLTTPALASGINFNDVNQVILFAPPESFPKLKQITDLTGNNATINILFNNSTVLFSENEEQIKDNGEITFMQKQKELSVDKYNARKIYKKRFPGYSYEFNAVRELLTEIRFDIQNNTETIKELLYDYFGKQFSFFYYPAAFPNKLEIRCEAENFGILTFNRYDPFDFEKSNVKLSVAEEVLSYIYGLFLKKVPQNIDVFDWLKKDTHKPPQTGIEKLFETNQDNTIPKIIKVGFTNDTIHKITKLLQENVSVKFDKKTIEKIYQNTQSVDEFIVELSKISTIDIKKPVDIQPQLKNLYPKIRTKQLTLQVINRLKIINVVSDFLINNDDNEIEIQLNYQTDEQLLNNLYNYMKAITSKHRASLAFEEIVAFSGKTVLQKSINYLLYFIYREIAYRNYDDLKIMQKITLDILQDNTKKEVNKFSTLYFDAKYASSYFVPSLIKDSQRENIKLDTLKKYIRETGEFKDNLKHLQSSCNYLLEENQENYACILLKSYSDYTLDDKTKDTEEIVDNIIDGFTIYYEKNQLTNIEYKEQQREFINLLLEKKSEPEKTEDLDTYIEIKSIVSWLKHFNQKFLKGYDRQN